MNNNDWNLSYVDISVEAYSKIVSFQYNGEYLVYSDVIQCKGQPESLLYVDVSNEGNGMIGKIMIIKCELNLLSSFNHVQKTFDMILFELTFGTACIQDPCFNLFILYYQLN